MSVQKPEDKKTLKRKLFLEAARKLFSEKGFQATNVTDIVAAVKSGQGTFYYHFKDKQAIFDELMISFINRLTAAVAENDSRAAGRLALTHRDLAVTNAKNIASVFVNNIDLARLFFNESRYIGGDAMKQLEQLYDFLHKQLETGLREGQASGAVRAELDPWTAARCFSGAAERVICEIVRSGEPADLDAVAAQIVDFQSVGILTDRSPETERSIHGKACDQRRKENSSGGDPNPLADNNGR